MKIQPLADRIVVKVLEAKEVTKGGIVLPDTAKEKPQEAEVIAVGTGKVCDGKVVAPMRRILLFSMTTSSSSCFRSCESILL